MKDIAVAAVASVATGPASRAYDGAPHQTVLVSEVAGSLLAGAGTPVRFCLHHRGKGELALRVVVLQSMSPWNVYRGSVMAVTASLGGVEKWFHECVGPAEGLAEEPLMDNNQMSAEQLDRWAWKPCTEVAVEE